MRSKKSKFLAGLLCIIIIIAAAVKIKDYATRPVFSSSAKTKHLIVISVDALNAQDLDELETLPHFKELLDKGSYAKEVVGVYPSLTYPSHTAIITGTYPDKNGIYTNEVVEPGVMKQKWFWYKKDIKVPTLCDIAEQSNMKVGTIFWPVMAGADVDYNMPDIWTTKDGENQSLLTLKSGTPIPVLEIYLRYSKLLVKNTQPYIDNFSAAASCYIIKSKKPNLLLMHMSEVDHARHKHGFMSQNAKDALKDADKHIGEIIQAAKDAGIYDDTTFVVLGDHGFADVNYKICLNVAFRNAGLINVDSKGKLTDWKAYANYCDGSVQIVLKNNKDTETMDKVKEILYNLKSDPASGIKEVYTKEEAAAKRVTGDFVFMCEAKPGYYFTNDWNLDEVINKIDPSQFDEYNDTYYVATHGFDPLTPNYRTFFMASGAGIKKGFVVPSINIVDEGPTMAQLLGLRMDHTDGKVIEDIIQ